MSFLIENIIQRLSTITSKDLSPDRNSVTLDPSKHEKVDNISTPKRPTSGQKKELGRKQAAEKEEMGATTVAETMNDTIPAGVDPIPLDK